MAIAERFGDVTWEGAKQTALGSRLAVGDRAPDFDLVDPDLQPLRSQSFAGRALLLSTVPSLDTPVCDLETRRWSEKTGGLEPRLASAPAMPNKRSEKRANRIPNGTW